MSRLQHALEVGLHNRAILLSRVGGPFNVAGKGIVITDVPKTEEDRNKLQSILLRMLSGIPVSHEDRVFLNKYTS